MGRTYSGIDVLTCVQGNTARALSEADHNTENCVVYDFTSEVSARSSATGYGRVHRSYSNTSPRNSDKNKRTVNNTVPGNTYNETAYRKRRRQNIRKKAARARRVNAIRACVLAAFLTVVFIGGGIASNAQSRRVPEAYKYYDTITVAYQENILDIVQRYDNRDYYETQFDYLEELCRINNIKYDGTAYPDVSPGTHLVVPYYSSELK